MAWQAILNLIKQAAKTSKEVLAKEGVKEGTKAAAKEGAKTAAKEGAKTAATEGVRGSATATATGGNNLANQAPVAAQNAMGGEKTALANQVKKTETTPLPTATGKEAADDKMVSFMSSFKKDDIMGYLTGNKDIGTDISKKLIGKAVDTYKSKYGEPKSNLYKSALRFGKFLDGVNNFTKKYNIAASFGGPNPQGQAVALANSRSKAYQKDQEQEYYNEQLERGKQRDLAYQFDNSAAMAQGAKREYMPMSKGLYDGAVARFGQDGAKQMVGKRPDGTLGVRSGYVPPTPTEQAVTQARQFNTITHGMQPGQTTQVPTDLAGYAAGRGAQNGTYTKPAQTDMKTVYVHDPTTDSWNMKEVPVEKGKPYQYGPNEYKNPRDRTAGKKNEQRDFDNWGWKQIEDELYSRTGFDGGLDSILDHPMVQQTGMSGVLPSKIADLRNEQSPAVQQQMFRDIMNDVNKALRIYQQSQGQ